MDSADFEARMRRLEYFHGLRTLPGAWVALRVDEELPMKDAYAAFIQGILDTVPLDQEA